MYFFKYSLKELSNILIDWFFLFSSSSSRFWALPDLSLLLETKQLLYSTLHYSEVQNTAVQYSTAQYRKIKHTAVQTATVQYTVLKYNSQYNTVHCSTVKYSALQYSTVQCTAVSYSACTLLHMNMYEKEEKQKYFWTMCRSKKLTFYYTIESTRWEYWINSTEKIITMSFSWNWNILWIFAKLMPFSWNLN